MRRILIVAVVSSLATGAVIAATGIAQSGGGADNSPPPTMAQALRDHQSRRDARLGRIAQRLNVSTDRLRSAIDKVRRDRLDARVRAGELTAAQRDAILACRQAPLTCDRSNLPAPAFRPRRAPWPPRGAPRPERRFDQFTAAVARELGIDAAKVRAAFRAERPRLAGPEGRPPHGPPGMRPGAFVAPAGEPAPVMGPGPEGLEDGPPGVPA